MKVPERPDWHDDLCDWSNTDLADYIRTLEVKLYNVHAAVAADFNGSMTPLEALEDIYNTIGEFDVDKYETL